MFLVPPFLSNSFFVRPQVNFSLSSHSLCFSFMRHIFSPLTTFPSRLIFHNYVVIFFFWPLPHVRLMDPAFFFFGSISLTPFFWVLLCLPPLSCDVVWVLIFFSFGLKASFWTFFFPHFSLGFDTVFFFFPFFFLIISCPPRRGTGLVPPLYDMTNLPLNPALSLFPLL